MNTNTKIATVGLALALAFSSLAPTLADGLQNQKNNDRNLAIGAGAVGILGLLTHNTGVAILGGAVAAGAGSQYEQDRHVQSQEQNDGYYAQNCGPNGYGNPNYGGTDIVIGGYEGRDNRGFYTGHQNRERNFDRDRIGQRFNDNRGQQNRR